MALAILGFEGQNGGISVADWIRHWYSISLIFRLLLLDVHHLYTRQLFLRYKREIFILGVLGFLK